MAPTALVPPTNGLRPAPLVAPVGAARRLALSWRVPYAGDVDAARRGETRAKAGSIASVLGDEGAGTCCPGRAARATRREYPRRPRQAHGAAPRPGLRARKRPASGPISSRRREPSPGGESGVPRYRVRGDQLAGSVALLGTGNDDRARASSRMSRSRPGHRAGRSSRVLSPFRRRGAARRSTRSSTRRGLLLETGLVPENLCLTVVAREFLRKRIAIGLF